MTRIKVVAPELGMPGSDVPAVRRFIMGINQTSNAERLGTEIVIIGGGGAGLAAAIAAGEKGVNSIVLEKRHNAGGNSVFAIGLFAADG
jgi:urocanate reductase